MQYWERFQGTLTAFLAHREKDFFESNKISLYQIYLLFVYGEINLFLKQKTDLLGFLKQHLFPSNKLTNFSFESKKSVFIGHSVVIGNKLDLLEPTTRFVLYEKTLFWN